jgi:hypothetical protein
MTVEVVRESVPTIAVRMMAHSRVVKYIETAVELLGTYPEPFGGAPGPVSDAAGFAVNDRSAGE